MDVFLLWVLCVVRGLYDELVTRPEKSYRLWCVVACVLETSWMRRPRPTRGLSHQEKKKSCQSNEDPTDIFKKKWKQTLHQCPHFINKHNIRALIQKHPVPAVRRAQLKQHKPDIPIRFAVSNIITPTYVCLFVCFPGVTTHYGCIFTAQ